MRKYIIALVGVIGLVAPSAQAYTAPDFKLKCGNGKYAKVWLAPFKAVNNCRARTLVVSIEVGDNGFQYRVAPRTTVSNTSGYDISGTTAWLER
jgi:hypothetical protein